MLRSLFGRKKKRPASTETPETIADARVGDVFTISSASVTHADAYFIVEKVNRYESHAGETHEMLGVDGDNAAVDRVVGTRQHPLHSGPTGGPADEHRTAWAH